MASPLATGFILGLPLAASVGPIALLLVESGVERGVRRSVPAALGVATADLALASMAAAGGTALVAVLHDVRVPLRVVAALVLLWIVAGLLRRPDGSAASAMSNATEAAREAARSFGRFLGLTLANPLTLLMFSSLVLAGGAVTGSPAWAVGVAAGSLVAQVGFVVVGAVAGRALDDRWTLRLRRGAALAIVVLVGFQLAGG